MDIWNGVYHLFVALRARDDAGKTEDIPGRIVGMDRHTDTRFLARGHDPAQKINEIFKQFFVRDALVRFQQSAEFFGRVAFVPARQTQAVPVQLHQRFVAV